MAQGTLISVYLGYELREATQHASGISLGVNIYKAGEFIGYEKNVAMAKSRIDVDAAKAKERQPATTISTPPPPEAQTLTPEQRRTRAAKLMGRCENNPDDLI